MRDFGTVDDYVIRVVEDPCQLDESAWGDLLRQQAEPTPFLDLRFLRALHHSGSATPSTGWAPLFITLWRQGVLEGACPLYLKSHSRGEYVFDWAWADAYERAGLRYYPKLLSAVPFTPVPGTRLLARDAAARRALVAALGAAARHLGVSSAHVLFIDETDSAAFAQAGWLLRQGVQFHWQQDEQRPIIDFQDLLSRLQRDKRKKIQQEQRRVREAGVTFRAVTGESIDDDLWDHFYACYDLTYRLHRSTPYLTRDFLRHMARDMPQHWVMFVASIDGERVASSLLALDPKRRVAYGRYWGSLRHVPNLHFDACYYQPLAWCLEHGYRRFEGGAQGEHKMARGLLPVTTQSAHWIADDRFAHAVEDYLQREGAQVGAYVDELREHSPFKAGSGDRSGT